MNCPSCGAPEKALVKYCQSCGKAFACQDLIELQQLEFLLTETAGWDVAEKLRGPYLNRLNGLRSRLRRLDPIERRAVTAPASTPVPQHERVIPGPEDSRHASPPGKPAPRKDPIPFEQWLLSERNIKIALYTGGLLLLVAGVIFIGVNWARLPGPAKFAVTLVVTSLMYLAGIALFRRPMLRLGGIALLAVASGFLTLNFAVLQIYVLAPKGLRDDVMWLIASSLCLLFYLSTSYLTRHSLFTYASLLALGSIVTASLVVTGAPWLAFVMAASLLALMLLYSARMIRSSSLADFTQLPITITAQSLMPLTFVAAFIMLFGRSALETNALGSSWMALISLALAILFYGLGAYWSRSRLLMYLSLTSGLATLAGLLWLMGASGLVYTMAGGLLPLALLVLAVAVQDTGLSAFTRQPFLVTAHVVTPIALFSAIAGWLSYTGCTRCDQGSPWLAITTMGLGVLFYGLNDALFKRLEARWAAAMLLPVAFAFTLVELGVSDLVLAIGLMFLAFLFLGSGHMLERRGRGRWGAWPLYGMAYAIAIFVTLLAIRSTPDLVKILVGDVILLALSGAIHRDYRWVYGAAWLFILPVYIHIGLSVSEFYKQGLLMGFLGLAYTATGYVMGRRRLRLGGPFLTAAAFIALVSVALTWQNPVIATLVLLAIAGLYLLVALWTRWEGLLLPALLAVQLAIFTLNSQFFSDFSALERSLTLSFFALGATLALIGAVLRARARERWFWPLYLVALANLAGPYTSALVIGGWMAVGLSVVLALILLAFAWLERAWFTRMNLPPVLAYLGIAALFIGHFYALDMAISLDRGPWTPYTAGLCALFVAMAWALRSPQMEAVYGRPLRRAGLWLLGMPLTGALILADPVLGAVTYAVTGVIYILDAAFRRLMRLGYLAIGAFLAAFWFLLFEFDVTEYQAYVIPLGIALLGIGWNERVRGARLWYRIPTLLGLLVLMGSALIQSLPRSAHMYALLLLIQSLIAIGWGARTHSRGYVQVGALALIANAVVQLGPAFVEMERWVQLGITGTILLGGGIAALFKREEILVARHKLTEEWGRWDA